jgi:heat shock 70kDa protein 4
VVCPRNEAFALEASYTPDSEIPESFSRKVGSWTVGPPRPTASGEKAKIKVRVRLNLHGIVGIESAFQTEEEEYEEVVKKAAAEVAKDVPMQDAADGGKAEGGDEGAEALSAEAAAEAKPVSGKSAAGACRQNYMDLFIEAWRCPSQSGRCATARRC